jgi:predicted adenylyl cyclase CyaB
MAGNVEWKARIHDLPHQRELAQQLAGTPPVLLEQVDTFFHVPHGRLKLRRLSPEHGQLIHYFRPDQKGLKQSSYRIVGTDQPEALHELLAQALGERGEVRKQRWLYRVGQVRIHLDEVEELGTFLEVEVVLYPGQSLAEGEQIAERFRLLLGVREEDLIAVAYIDLLMAQTGCSSISPRMTISTDRTLA